MTRKLIGNVITYSFKFNEYDACPAHHVVNRKQHTIRFHIDDLMSSHQDHYINIEFQDSWINSAQESEQTMVKNIAVIFERTPCEQRCEFAVAERSFGTKDRFKGTPNHKL